MFHFSKIFGLVLLGALVWSLAAPARADDLAYLPDGCMLFYSVDMSGLLKSKAYQEAKTKVKDFDLGMQRSFRDALGIADANTVRLTSGIAGGDDKNVGDVVMVATLLKPVTAADVKTNYKWTKFLWRNYSFKEIKVGKHTIHQESFTRNQKLIEGVTFCVVDEKVILYSDRAEPIKRVLERDKKAKLSANLETGLKAAGMDNTLTFVVDVTQFPKGRKKELIEKFGQLLPETEKGFDGLQTVIVQGTADDRIKLSATMTCKNAAAADEVRAATQVVIDLHKTEFRRESERGPIPRLKPAQKAVYQALDAVKLSTKGAQVNAELTVDAAAVVTMLELLR